MLHRPLPAADLQVLCVLLDRLQDVFSNAGCNDFNLIDDGRLKPEDVAPFLARVRSVLTQDEIDDSPDQTDGLCLGYFQEIFGKQLESAQVDDPCKFSP